MIPLFEKTRRHDRGQGYPPVGRCIYCGTDQGPLNREHIIPLGLSGDRTLPQASCFRCQKITGEIERQCLREMLRPIRTRLGMSSRRKKDRPKKLVLQVHHDGHYVTHHLPVENYPTVLATFSFDTPRLLSCEPPQKDGSRRAAPGIYGLNVDLRSYIDTYAGTHGGKGLSFGKTHPGLYSRMLAKIAHAYTVAEYGLDSFTPLLVDLILKGSGDPSDLVGGQLDKPGYTMKTQETRDFHAIMIDERKVGQREYLVVTLQLFACLNAPTYYVVTGEKITA